MKAYSEWLFVAVEMKPYFDVLVFFISIIAPNIQFKASRQKRKRDVKKAWAEVCIVKENGNIFACFL